MDAAAQAAFPLNPRAAIRTVRIGAEQQPVIVVDDALQRPQALADYAAREVAFEPAERWRSGYPGLLGPAPLAYVETLVRALDPLIRETFGLEGAEPGQAQCNFSLVTLPPDALSLEQRLPHVDTVDPLQIAILHFLCPPGFGGTAFFRHRTTGFESLTPERLAPYEAALAGELAAGPPPAGYIAGDTPLFARTGAFEARFDRVLVYRSALLHSGEIIDPATLDANPARGRLTANIFLRYARNERPAP
jgi:hypothetical protein